LIGPLSNPAGAPRQVVGVWHRDLVEKIANVLNALKTERAWVVHGDDGLDEVTLDGHTTVSEVRDGNVSTFRLSPQDFGMSGAHLDHLRGGGPEMNAKIIRSVLSGELRDEARALIVVNAAAALFVGGKAETLSQAAQLAELSIDSGAALGKLEALIKATQKANSKFQIPD
jgi:anthranilate phosphoribosyltransferase